MTETLNINHDDSDKIDFETKVIINEREYWRSPAQYLANYVTKQQCNGIRYSAEYGFSSAKLFVEALRKAGSLFEREFWSEKRFLGELFFDAENNQIILKKTIESVDKYEFCKEEKQIRECFSVQYDIFRYLRDTDLIEIHIIERKIRHKEKFVYIISKLKAVKSGYLLNINGFGSQFFIPKPDFKCIERKLILNNVKKKKK